MFLVCLIYVLTDKLLLLTRHTCRKKKIHLLVMSSSNNSLSSLGGHSSSDFGESSMAKDNEVGPGQGHVGYTLPICPSNWMRNKPIVNYLYN